jgi:heat-inducible transcriptional repressor
LKPSIPEREENVLSSVIHAYVATAKPVASQALTGRLDISSATIRNSFMDLEKRGYLTHPYTSAGRVPMDQGYRFYVDRLMKARQVTLKEKQQVEVEYQRSKDEVETLVRHTARILSAMTRLAGLAVFHIPSDLSLDHFRFVPIDGRRVMVILVMDQGLVREELVTTDASVDPKEVMKITQVLNRRFGGQTLAAIRSQLLQEAESVKRAKLGVVEAALQMVEEALRFSADTIHLEGASHLAEQPEFHDPQLLEQVVRLVEERSPLASVLGRQWSNPGLSVSIGRELPQAELRHFSFVHVPYYYQGKVAGALGVLGPTRMAYDRVCGQLSHMARELEATLTRRGG